MPVIVEGEVMRASTAIVRVLATTTAAADKYPVGARVTAGPVPWADYAVLGADKLRGPVTYVPCEARLIPATFPGYRRPRSAFSVPR